MKIRNPFRDALESIDFAKLDELFGIEIEPATPAVKPATPAPKLAPATPAKPTATPPEQLSLDARAMAVLADNQHFTKVSQVAAVLHVTHQALHKNKCPAFRRYLALITQSPPPPRGFKAGGDIEASNDGKAIGRRRNRLPE